MVRKYIVRSWQFSFAVIKTIFCRFRLRSFVNDRISRINDRTCLS